MLHLYFCFVSRMTARQSNTASLSCNHARLSVAGLVAPFFRFATHLSTTLLGFDSSLSKEEKAHHMTVVGLSSHNAISLLRVLMHISSRFLAKQEFSRRVYRCRMGYDSIVMFFDIEPLPHHRATLNVNSVQNFLDSHRLVETVSPIMLHVTASRLSTYCNRRRWGKRSGFGK